LGEPNAGWVSEIANTQSRSNHNDGEIRLCLVVRTNQSPPGRGQRCDSTKPARRLNTNLQSFSRDCRQLYAGVLADEEARYGTRRRVLDLLRCSGAEDDVTSGAVGIAVLAATPGASAGVDGSAAGADDVGADVHEHGADAEGLATGADDAGSRVLRRVARGHVGDLVRRPEDHVLRQMAEPLVHLHSLHRGVQRALRRAALEQHAQELQKKYLLVWWALPHIRNP
jgi:hypothetical protein